MPHVVEAIRIGLRRLRCGRSATGSPPRSLIDRFEAGFAPRAVATCSRRSGVQAPLRRRTARTTVASVQLKGSRFAIAVAAIERPACPESRMNSRRLSSVKVADAGQKLDAGSHSALVRFTSRANARIRCRTRLVTIVLRAARPLACSRRARTACAIVFFVEIARGCVVRVRCVLSDYRPRSRNGRMLYSAQIPASLKGSLLAGTASPPRRYRRLVRCAEAADHRLRNRLRSGSAWR